MLSIHGLAVHYGVFQAVHDLAMEVPVGQVVSLLGANGSGKSTILKTVSGLKTPTEGEIRFEGSRIDGMKPDAIVRLGIGSVLEGRRLFPYMTVLENLRMGAFSRNDKAGIARGRREAAGQVPASEGEAARPDRFAERRPAGDRRRCPRPDGAPEAADHG